MVYMKQIQIFLGSIYGLSYISFEYVLSFYGLIPEKDSVVTSTTCGKKILLWILVYLLIIEMFQYLYILIYGVKSSLLVLSKN